MNDSYCLDANVLITAWHQLYPIDVFPSLWKKISGNKEKLILIESVFKEIEPFSGNKAENEKYPLRMWLLNEKFKPVPVIEEIQSEALLLEKAYETKRIGKGANETDILLIAYAKMFDKQIVSLEAQQKQHPKNKSDYKIPLICEKENVQCIDFVKLLQKLKIII